MRAQEVVRRYAVTLLEASQESGVGEEEIRRDIEGLEAALRGSDELAEFLRNPLLQPEAKRSGLEALFSGRVQPLTLNFLRLLVERRRIGLLPEIARGFLDLLDRRSGMATAQVTSAVALTPEQEERLRGRLAAYTGLRIRLDASVDPGLGGGLVARVDDLVFDGSVETQLERLRARLMEA
ncbi:MAG: ATP synthase F1 subunit delta [Gemmatimonadetes bacterium]|nr:ATP synthase F1 subunit delta [Gemmatimonadota bacterium]